MRTWDLIKRGLWFHRRTNMGVAAGVAVGAAVLTGALLVGDSMRHSLRDAVLQRLGGVEHAVQSPQFFDANLAQRVATQRHANSSTATVVPAISLTAGVDHADSSARVRGVGLFGVDDRFWHLATSDADGVLPMPAGRSVILNDRLANELDAKIGDFVLIRTAKPSDVALETLLGRRDDASLSMRLEVTAIIPAQGLGGFSLFAQQVAKANAFVPLVTLQDALNAKGKANLLLFPGLFHGTDSASEASETASQLQSSLQDVFQLGDVGLTVRTDDKHGYAALESESMLLTPEMERAGLAAAKSLGLPALRILTYLANEIAVATPDNPDRASRAVPYSTIAAIDPQLATMFTPTGNALTLPEDGIILNDWTARDLGVKIGDKLTVRYYLTGRRGRLETHDASFTLTGVVDIAGPAGDAGFTPTYEGITNVRNIADWDPPFPVDLNRIRDKDEAYWDDHRATPKAFVHLARGRSLWAKDGDRFGRTTSIRVYASPGDDVRELAAAFAESLKDNLDAARFGLRVQPIRQRALEGSTGSTDFGGLFIGFSFFLIAAAAMLVALLFRLNAERRASELGLLLATGFTRKHVLRILLIEALLISGIATAVGLLAASGYAWLMLAGLRTWWSTAVSAPFLKLYASPTSYAVGFFCNVVVAVGSMAWSLRGLMKIDPSRLLAGATAPVSVALERSQADPSEPRTSVRADTRSSLTPGRNWGAGTAVAGATIAVALMISHVATGAPSQVLTFFGSGAAVLTASLAGFSYAMARQRLPKNNAPGLTSTFALSMSNIPRHRGRSMLTVGLIASATFIIASLQAFTLDSSSSTDPRDRATGSGGFALFAESAAPLPFDLNTPEGRTALNIASSAETEFNDTTIVPFRLRRGDETSCLNLYQPKEPKIIGATNAMIQRGGFIFSATSAESPEQRLNPWLLLDKPLPDGAIPAIGDEAAVLWQLHSGLGRDLPITNERGDTVTLRFVALLSGSALQNELIVSEAHFEQIFPSVQGYAFFLIDPPADRDTSLRTTLERELTPYGMDVGTTARRIADFNAVQNTYISTFQTLGGLGLVLGTAGLGAVLMRNVWERRSELALFQALGFRRSVVSRMVMLEHLALAAGGLTIGFASAALAVAPHIFQDGSAKALLKLLPPLAGALAVGAVSALLALRPTLRAPLIPALRRE